MQAVVVSIGTEVVRGELLNTNAEFLASRLTELGFHVFEHVSVEDDFEQLHALYTRLAQGEPKLVLATGGLGPTTDDLTAESIARFRGVELVRDAAAYAAIEQRMQSQGRSVSASNARQAEVPAGSVVLANPVGSAPGFGCELAPAVHAFFMPGVPAEMRAIFEQEIVPRVRAWSRSPRHQIRLRTFGLWESQVGDLLRDLEPQHPGLILGYRAHFPEVEVKVLAVRPSLDEAVALAEQVTAEVRRRLGAHVYGDGEQRFAQFVLSRLAASGRSLALAESCTGGLVAQMLTAEPGASEVLWASVVAYANAAKTALLGVPAELIEQQGAVSEAVARAMAEGARARTGSDLAVAITGVAGPGGGSADKPVGTVWFAVSSAAGTHAVREALPATFGRKRVQILAAYRALQLAVEAVPRESTQAR